MLWMPCALHGAVSRKTHLPNPNMFYVQLIVSIYNNVRILLLCIKHEFLLLLVVVVIVLLLLLPFCSAPAVVCICAMDIFQARIWNSICMLSTDQINPKRKYIVILNSNCMHKLMWIWCIVAGPQTNRTNQQKRNARMRKKDGTKKKLYHKRKCEAKTD